MNIRDFLQFGRVGSWPLMLIPVIVPYLLNQPLLSVYTLWLFILTFMLQIAWVSHNAVTDYQWDKNDPSKQHHPLIAGRIKYDFAVRFVSWYMLIFYIIVLATCIFYPSANHYYALVFLFFSVIGGHCYNDFAFAKYTLVSWIPITVFMASIAGLGYFLGTTEFNSIIIFIILYSIFREWFQISYSGRLKDIATEEQSEIKLMGARYEESVIIPGGAIFKEFHPGYSWIYAGALTFCQSLVGLYIFIHYSYSFYLLPIHIAFLSAGWFVLCKIVKPREYNHSKELVYLTVEEIIFICWLPVILSPLVGYYTIAAVLGFALTWFVASNKYIWNVPVTKF